MEVEKIAFIGARPHFPVFRTSPLAGRMPSWKHGRPLEHAFHIPRTLQQPNMVQPFVAVRGNGSG